MCVCVCVCVCACEYSAMSCSVDGACRLVDVCAAESQAVEQRTQLLCRWLDLELATAGNVSCVVGTPSDPWYQPCVELVEQRAAGEGQVGGAIAGWCPSLVHATPFSECLCACSLHYAGHCCGRVSSGEQEHTAQV